ncbi:histone deacetylase family protein [Patescibacteria group bacterium]|nr:histone deacetylase family protein [Patescibacteria group bacterium]
MNIPVIYNKNHHQHNPKLEIYEGKRFPHVEKPDRISSILTELKNEKIGELIDPADFDMEFINQVHSKDYINFFKKISNKARKKGFIFPSNYILDTYTLVQASTFKIAKKSADVALTGAEMILNGEKLVYSLCRPPGHHAEKNKMGGYCYFNNAGIAGQFLSSFGKVAILDIDIHHGNGTQNIFYERKDVFFVSIHADPNKMYPYSTGFEDEKGIGKGAGFNINYPLSVGTGELKYKKTLEKAILDIKKFKPKYLIVSTGFDTYVNDPIGGFKLKTPFYKKMGQKIASLRIPTLIIQEGGYNIKELGKLAVSFLKGFN